MGRGDHVRAREMRTEIAYLEQAILPRINKILGKLPGKALATCEPGGVKALSALATNAWQSSLVIDDMCCLLLKAGRLPHVCSDR